MADLSCATPCILFSVTLLVLLLSSLNNFLDKASAPLSNNLSKNSEIIVPIPGAVKDDHHYFYNASTISTSKIVQKMEEGLARARAAIRKATITRNYTSDKEESFIPRGSIYVDPYAFHQSYIEMEKRFRVWTYGEGERSVVDTGKINDIYSIEGEIIDELYSGKSPFQASNADEALAFFVPVSIASAMHFIWNKHYLPYSHHILIKDAEGYIGLISRRYPNWNRSRGADHFMISCKEWAAEIPGANPELYKHFIRVTCNANSSQGFKLARDVYLPDFKLPRGELEPARILQPSQDNRSILALFYGAGNGNVRELLLKHWKGKDNEIQVYHQYLSKTINYTELLSKSKYCLCPGDWDVASSTVVEAIYSGCVPVIISDYNYVLPFSDVLDWTKFSVHIPVARIPEIKTILQNIPVEEFLEKQKSVIQVQRHFQLNRPAKPFDVVHMVMHSLWLRRLNIKLPIL